MEVRVLWPCRCDHEQHDFGQQCQRRNRRHFRLHPDLEQQHGCFQLNQRGCEHDTWRNLRSLHSDDQQLDCGQKRGSFEQCRLVRSGPGNCLSRLQPNRLVEQADVEPGLGSAADTARLSWRSDANARAAGDQPRHQRRQQSTHKYSTDQRGTGFDRVVGSKADIGAYERQPDDDEIFYGGFD